MEDEKMVCQSCKGERKASDKFCPSCGKERLLMRSENEIRALRERLKTVKGGGNLAGLVLLIAVDTTLSWTLGSSVNPIDLLEAANAEKKKEEAQS